MRKTLIILILLSSISIFCIEELNIVDWEITNKNNSTLMLSKLDDMHLVKFFEEDFNDNYVFASNNLPYSKGIEHSSKNYSYMDHKPNIYKVHKLLIRTKDIIISGLDIKIEDSKTELIQKFGDPDFIFTQPFVNNPISYYFFDKISPINVKDYVYKLCFMIKDNTVTGIILSSIEYQRSVFNNSLIGTWKNPAGRYYESNFIFRENGDFDFNGLTSADFTTSGKWKLYFEQNKPILNLKFSDNSIINWTQNMDEWKTISNIYKIEPENKELHLYLNYEMENFLIVVFGNYYRKVIKE